MSSRSVTKSRLLNSAALPLVAAIAICGFASQGFAQGATFRTLYDLGGGNDGYRANALIADKAGNFYGATWQGGASNNGTVFKLAPDGTHTILYTFTGGADG